MESENIKSSKVLSWVMPILATLAILILNDMRDGIKEGKDEVKEARAEFSQEIKEVREDISGVKHDVYSLKLQMKNSSITSSVPSDYYAYYKGEDGKSKQVFLRSAVFIDEGESGESPLSNQKY
ncbi:hypothetical protein VCHA53O463_110129 [Vibrio chagasii]|nr:hypothetical protein VCHA35P150_20424 [Vibrio chagasii]CAH6904965.1 hypothetical protein VCHA56P515_100033 [Vibrio chagasii]CAH6970491.1 hypothetical protein VCHA53O463_110129 [Vibrio chagasii]CAH7049367.1 hypothetical protein VCHA36P166_50182 [Vibrio chagasii]CAH7387803.1 hypothetical protein VCHA53O464_20044 [Vibrio chagasii]